MTNRNINSSTSTATNVNQNNNVSTATNVNQNIQSGENSYVTNFFTDEGNVTVSGGEMVGSVSTDNPTIQLAQIASVTS
jgi:hypothetical protein